jgi:sarcosine oxidase subunit beta
VEDVVVQHGRVVAVQTTLGRVETPAVICAAGAWSRAVGEMAGVALDVTPLRRQVVFTEPIPDLPPDLPMAIDFATGFYFHREGQGLLMGVSFDEEPGFKLDYTDAWLPTLVAAAERRAPAILRAGIRGGWAGLYEVTPDHNAIVGEAAAVSRFLYATGFSGHGFLQAPAIGEVVRDLYLGREPVVDVAGLSAERFAAGRVRPERNVI